MHRRAPDVKSRLVAPSPVTARPRKLVSYGSTSRPRRSHDTGGIEALTLLRVRNLAVQFRGDDGSAVTVVEDASFDLAAGEILGVLGESGSGKTTLALALLGLLPPGGRVIGGEVVLRGRPAEEEPTKSPPGAAQAARDLLRMSEKELTAVRGDEMSIVFQEPGISLSPCLRAGDQVADVARAHRRWSRRRCREHAFSLLAEAGFEQPDEIYAAYPHQLSGGQRQRVVIAQALACRPAILIADEPTAALDATTEARIVALLRELKERLGLALVFISHDAALLASLADRLLVMYAGQIVEQGSREHICREPSHPYTRDLLRCAPRPIETSGAGRSPLPVIPGAPPDPARWPPGCRFEPRCCSRKTECRQRRPPMLQLDGSRCVRCLRYEH